MSTSRHHGESHGRLPLLCIILLVLWVCSACSTVPDVPRPLPDAPPLLVSLETLQAIQKKHGLAARLRVEAWANLIHEQRDAAEQDKLKAVNDFINRLYFESDELHWGAEDYWATPLETLATNGGDCEDFTIAKYFTLQRLGVADDCMRLTYVKSLAIQQPHMVLTYQCVPGEDPLVLDNLVKMILPASARTDLVPVYSFNAEGLWIARRRGDGRRVGEARQMSVWDELLNRLEE